MKNVSKLLLLGILAGAGYFLGMVVYGADCPSVFGAYVCNSVTNDVCNNPWWTCLCNAVSINHWVTCSSVIDPTADGTLWTVDNGNICGDSDWCTCWITTIAKWAMCSIIVSDITAPILVWWSISVVNKTATFPFTCSEWSVIISCLWACGSCSLTANTGNNSVSFTLSNGTYNNCSLVGQDQAGNISTVVNIPSFTINYSAGGGWGGGGSWTPVCSDAWLVCTNWVYTVKPWYYCLGGNLGKICSTSSSGITLSKLITSIYGLTETGFESSLETIKTKNSTLYEYKPQGVVIKIYVPKYKIYLIKKTILTLNNRLISAINKKLIKITDPSYMIENYEYLTADSKIVVYKDIGALTKTYNNFLGVLYMVLDMKEKKYLPLAKWFLENYFKDFANFQK